MIALRCYDPTRHGVGGIHAWLNGHPPDFLAQIHNALELLSIERSVASAPQIKPLRGPCAGLSEIVIEFRQGNAQIHIRILGMPDGQHAFVLLLGFQKFSNADYGAKCPPAQNRKQGVIKDARRAGPCVFP